MHKTNGYSYQQRMDIATNNEWIELPTTNGYSYQQRMDIATNNEWI